jgi:hypothetical protein
LVLEKACNALQDFLKEVDLQFLDHMRRGTSINFADLASDPPPATMQVCLDLASLHHLQEALTTQDAAYLDLLLVKQPTPRGPFFGVNNSLHEGTV